MLDPDYIVYPDSVQCVSGICFFIAKLNGTKSFVVLNDRQGKYMDFIGQDMLVEGTAVRICALNVENSLALRKVFPFTNPVSLARHATTFGLGDRLGVASAGHIRLLKGKKVFPVLAQQSTRELTLTGRDFKDVLAAAVWAVFQEGYTEGFGTDGDHLKSPQEIQTALENGYTMITLDCSEHIDNAVMNMTAYEKNMKYQEVDPDTIRELETSYLGKDFKRHSGDIIRYTSDALRDNVLIYYKAIQYAAQIYSELLSKMPRPIDFELSIDETLIPTTPEAHFFIASELYKKGVIVNSLAPRFVGEFQKGIDYRGNLDEFAKDFKAHAEIAKEFGYKISVHSGSDKFSVFPIIADITGGEFHIKTAGTNWLEAVRLVALTNPCLYREIHIFALENLAEAKKYYKVGLDVSKIPDVNSLSDEELPHLMDLDDARQLIHITYGLILQQKKGDGKYQYRDDFYLTLQKHENMYYELLEKHIGKHMSALKIGDKV